MPTPEPSLWRRISRRRLFWLLAAICILGIVGVLFENYQKSHRSGIIEYSSDDPDAQLVMEKDGRDFPLKKGVKYTMPFEPGSYKIRLVEGPKDLRYPPFLNLDPGGRGHVNVKKVAKAPGS